MDQRLDDLLRLLEQPCDTVEETCDRLLHRLQHSAGHDGIALLIARAQPLRPNP
ncbi:hypothetical protein ACWGLF_26385 [Streptomyces puniciscabiei]